MHEVSGRTRSPTIVVAFALLVSLATLAGCEGSRNLRLRQDAEVGNVSAMGELGDLYIDGEGFLSRSDLPKAYLWHQAAARRGRTESAVVLACMHLLGAGVPKDEGMADGLLVDAAQAGDVRARYILGMRNYLPVRRGFEGSAVRDLPEAARLFRQAAEQGDRDAQLMLSTMLDAGEGLPADPAAAKRWQEEGGKPQAGQRTSEWMEQMDRRLRRAMR